MLVENLAGTIAVELIADEVEVGGGAGATVAAPSIEGTEVLVATAITIITKVCFAPVVMACAKRTPS